MTALAVRSVSEVMEHAPLYVSRLALQNFRSYEAAEVLSDGRPMAFWGPNGAGKTNLLEAISLLAPGRGLRGCKLNEPMRRVGAASPRPWAIGATVGEIAIRTGLDEAERRDTRIQGEKAAPNDLGDHVRVLWLTPAMDRLFTDSPGARRKFLDRLVLGLVPRHGRDAQAYERAMRERQRLLNDEVNEPSWLDGLEATMAEAGAAMMRSRAMVVTKLTEAIAQSESAFPRADVALKPGSDVTEADEFRSVLARNRGRDFAAGRATIGPHRADLVVRHRLKDMPAADCSTGEQKALLIGLVLANARLQSSAHEGAAPLLLLDEIAAHLDEARREALFDEICALGAQAWMTGTDQALFEALGSRAMGFEVADGQIRPQTE